MSSEEKDSSPEPSKFSVTDRRHWKLEDLDETENPEERLPTYVQQLKKEAETKDERLKEYIAAYKNKTKVGWTRSKQIFSNKLFLFWKISNAPFNPHNPQPILKVLNRGSI